MTSRSVVLAGGGVSGIAWLLGVVTALRDGGVDLAAADAVLGTSAGSVVATQLATGVLDEAARAQLADETAERAVDFDFAAFLELAGGAAADATSTQDVARRMARLPLQQTTIGPDERRAIVAARLPVTEWPDRDLSVVAVDRETGARTVFRRDVGVGLVDAVTASCAVPGVWPPVAIDGRTYVDGGAWSLTNADLAAPDGTVLVLVPVVPTDDAVARLAAELEGARHTHVLAADDAAGAVFGPNPLDPATRADAFRAGRRQGEHALAQVREFWEG